MPDVPEELRWYLSSFYTLSQHRQVGMSLCPISMSDIAAYLSIYPWHDVDSFIAHITAMDGAYLTAVNKKQEAKSKSSQPAKNTPPPRKR